MYKVFYYERRLLIAGVGEIPPSMGGGNVFQVGRAEELEALTRDFLTGKIPELAIAGDREALWQGFQGLFNRIPAAGGLVKSRLGYLFIFRKGKWDLPKGKIDAGETPEVAAIREVMEETGLTSVSILTPLPSTWHIYSLPGSNPGTAPVLKETRWFLMEAMEGQALRPEAAEDIEQAGWFRPHQLPEVYSNTYPGIRELAERFC